jgi:glycosyl transferase family 25
MIKLYIINSDKALERKDFMIQQLESVQGIGVEFVSAIIGKDLDSFTQKLFANKIKCSHPEITWEITSGEVGCYLSHLEVYKRISNDESQNNWFVILEDDAIISDDFISIVSNPSLMNKINKSRYDLVVIGFDTGKTLSYNGPSNRYLHSIKKISRSVNIGYPKYNHYGSFAYMLNRDAARKLLKFGTENPSLSDYLLYACPRANVALGILNKPIVFPNFNFDSSIRENHSFLIKKFKLTKNENITLRQKISEYFRKPKYEYLK